MRRSDLRRPHTGRRRNDAARQAILDAAAHLLAQPDGLAVTVESIAAAAGVGKQTIYRWWPSKGAVLLEAMTERARQTASIPDTGVLLRDLETFFTATFRGVGSPPAAALLRAVMAEAQRDPHVAHLLREFTRGRRQALREILDRGRDRGELPSGADLELIVDQAYGVLWYRLMVGHAPLTADLAARLARSLCACRPSPGEQ
ncbi:MAG: TetR/AcrR family transcriptional regulator [Pseudonocardiaceae bacterium]